MATVRGDAAAVPASTRGSGQRMNRNEFCAGGAFEQAMGTTVNVGWGQAEQRYKRALRGEARHFGCFGWSKPDSTMQCVGSGGRHRRWKFCGKASAVAPDTERAGRPLNG